MGSPFLLHIYRLAVPTIDDQFTDRSSIDDNTDRFGFLQFEQEENETKKDTLTSVFFVWWRIGGFVAVALLLWRNDATVPRTLALSLALLGRALLPFLVRSPLLAKQKKTL